MTFSLAAHDAQTGMFGIASASSSIAVGNRCPWARAGVGVVLTQHRTDTRAGPLGLDFLTHGYNAQEVVNLLVAGSEHPGQRQFAALDREGRAAFFNGPLIESINAGHIGDRCVSVGNFLANVDVPQAMVTAYEAAEGKAFVERLLTALDAGVAKGAKPSQQWPRPCWSWTAIPGRWSICASISSPTRTRPYGGCGEATSLWSSALSPRCSAHSRSSPSSIPP